MFKKMVFMLFLLMIVIGCSEEGATSTATDSDTKSEASADVGDDTG